MSETGVTAMVKELADWDFQSFPLAGGDVVNMLVRFGLITAGEAKAAYIEAANAHGIDVSAPPEMMQFHLNGQDRW